MVANCRHLAERPDIVYRVSRFRLARKICDVQAAGGASQRHPSNLEVAGGDCSLCTGFLGEFEADISSLRSMIDALDQPMNLNRERVARKTPVEAKFRAKRGAR